MYVMRHVGRDIKKGVTHNLSRLCTTLSRSLHLPHPRSPELGPALAPSPPPSTSLTFLYLRGGVVSEKEEGEGEEEKGGGR